jgi:adenylate cyclase
MGKHRARIILGLLLVALFAGHVASLWHLPLLPRAEALLYDARVRMLAPHTQDDRIVVVDIDEKSLREKDQGGEGRWPWRRDRLAQLVDHLFQNYGVSLVALDIVLSEKDASSGLDVLEHLASHQLKDVPAFAQQLALLRPQLSFDHVLAQSMQAGPVVLGYAFHNDKPASATTLPEGLDAADWGLAQVRAQSYPGYSGLLPELAAQAAGAGHLNPLRDDDGVTRRVPLLVEHQGRYYPALSVAVIQALTGAPKVGVGVSDYGQDTGQIEKLDLGGLQVPVDKALNALVPYRGASPSFPYVSAVEVLQGRVPAAQLKDRIVLIGTSAAGLADLVTTPMGVSFPGVEVHANLITGMLDGRVLQAPAYAQGVELLAVLALGLLMVFCGAWLKPIYAIAVFVLALTATLALNLGLLMGQQLMLPLAAPLACLSGVFVFQMAYGFFIEARGKRQISELFANYVPPELVQIMAQDPQAFTMAPVERELTVLFADVRDFTSISEHLSPEALSELINAYLTAMSEVIRNGHQGTLDKYIGDAVMAFWGAPVANASHAQDAVRAALAMQRAAHQLNQDFQRKGWPQLSIGIGLNSGPMRVGDMGSKIRRAYTVMGDSVNLGARLEGLTKVYGVDVLIGENTRVQLPGWTCREVDRVRVKGKDRSVAIFEPLGLSSDLTADLLDEIARWDLALAAYRVCDWTQAAHRLETLRITHPRCGLYTLFAQRVAQFQQTPPVNGWDGSTRFDVK